MGHPDFRLRGKVFVTLGYPDKDHGALMLTPEQQSLYLRDAPEAFSPAAGAWGKAGSTVVRLSAADAETVGDAITAAWQNVSAKTAASKKRSQGARRPASPGSGRPRRGR